MKNLQPCEVVHRDELKEGGIDEEHANKVPPKPREKCYIDLEMAVTLLCTFDFYRQ